MPGRELKGTYVLVSMRSGARRSLHCGQTLLFGVEPPSDGGGVASRLVEGAFEAPGLLARFAQRLAGLFKLVVESDKVGFEVGDSMLVRVEHLASMLVLGRGKCVVRLRRVPAFPLGGSALRERVVDRRAAGLCGRALRGRRSRAFARRRDAAYDARSDGGELDRVAVLVDHAESDVPKGACQLSGAEELRGRRVDECGVEGFGESFRGLGRDAATAGGLVARDTDEVADQVVALSGEFAPSGAVGRQVGLAQLFAELGQGVDAVGIGADELVGEPGRHGGLAQGRYRSGGLLVSGVAGRLGQLVPDADELLGHQPVQLDDRGVSLHLSTMR
jgi:hypothetical protein